MNSLRRLCVVFLVPVVATFAVPALASQARADYAAIAFSKSTGQYGYSYGYGSRASAEVAAMNKVSAGDARAVAWVRNGYVALALGDDVGAYGWGWGSDPATARSIALREARKHTTNVYVVVTVFSGN